MGRGLDGAPREVPVPTWADTGRRPGRQLGQDRDSCSFSEIVNTRCPGTTRADHEAP